MKKRILWILTGGTFSCVGTDRGLMPRSGDEQAEKMLSLMPDIIENYDIMPLVLMNIDSSDMTVSHHRMIADAIDANIDKYDGIVMTHGTDTMAYTAAALSVMLRNPPIPIVLTGSQRPFFDEDSDAPKNFAEAVAVAANGSVRGISVVFDDMIISGRDCTKTDTVSDRAFTAVNSEIGRIVSGNVEITHPEKLPAGEYRYDSSLCKADGKVALLDMHPSFDPDIVGLLCDNGIKGLVIRCYGAGGIPERARAAFGKVITKGAKAIAVTQCLHGGTNLGIYAVGTDAERAGIIDGGDMTAEYAVAVMMKMISDMQK